MKLLFGFDTTDRGVTSGQAPLCRVSSGESSHSTYQTPSSHRNVQFQNGHLPASAPDFRARTRTWTVFPWPSRAKRIRQLARIGNNPNQLARWANTHKAGAEAGGATAWRSSVGIWTWWAAVADSLEFERKYRSVVTAWVPEERPTEEQTEALCEEFEQTAWAGLEPDGYAWTAVLHLERGGSVHAHILAAQYDLQPGRSLKIAPPAASGHSVPTARDLDTGKRWGLKGDL